MSDTWSKSGVKQPPHNPVGMSANANIKFKNLFSKNDNTQYQCGHNKTGSLIHSGQLNNTSLLESHLASGVIESENA